ncbi:DUF1036 domain-containing protein [Shimia sagamensis]|uniref:Uncharacterized membrane protein n=1 Tax=Shimia sagamensis TaxID=1566352 RepID=A0ABY1PHG1_9RHOB|nr:DUF1036 domain-containing protein [Shimia sagamensis]SMP33770.1 Uncharacterized membrane protein [Shimia sagamensis]
MKSTFWMMGLVAITLPLAAQAGLEICNEAGFPQSVAVAYKDGDGYRSRGWWNLDPGECDTPVSGDLKRRYYYVFATATGYAFDPVERYSFCTELSGFSIVGDEDCEARGYDKSMFAKIDTGKTAKDYRLNIKAGIFTALDRGASGGSTATPPAEIVYSTDSEARRILPLHMPMENSGFFGEPFSQVGIFQGCSFEYEDAFCSFHAEGWKYYVNYGNGTEDALLDALEFLPVGTPVSFGGDMISYGDITADTVIREVSYFPELDPYQHIREAMMGMWRDMTDTTAQVLIEGAEWTDMYNGEPAATYFLQIAERCDAGPGGPVLLQTNPEDREPYCYMIDRVTDEEMVLYYYGNPQPFVYRR